MSNKTLSPYLELFCQAVVNGIPARQAAMTYVPGNIPVDKITSHPAIIKRLKELLYGVDDNGEELTRVMYERECRRLMKIAEGRGNLKETATFLKMYALSKGYDQAANVPTDITHLVNIAPAKLIADAEAKLKQAATYDNPEFSN